VILSVLYIRLGAKSAQLEFINSDYVRRSFMVKYMLDLGYV
jgi:hypothetical protein